MTLEMGKTIAAARAEAAKCATACRYYAEHGERLLADEPVEAGPAAASSATSRSGRCWPSCRGISPSGRSSASPLRR